MRKPIEEGLANQKALLIVEDQPKVIACRQHYGIDDSDHYCLLANMDKPPTVILLGDSHAYHVSAGLMRYYSSTGENLLYLGTRFPYWGLPVEGNPFQKITQPMLEQALNTASARTVIFSSHLAFDRTAAKYMNAARETFRRFIASGKQVIFIVDVPTLPFDPRSCIRRAAVAASAVTRPCRMERSAWDAQKAAHEEALQELAREFPQVEWFRSWEALCDARFCYGMIDGRLMFRDDNHLSYDGDLRVGKYFAEWVRQRQSHRWP